MDEPFAWTSSLMAEKLLLSVAVVRDHTVMLLYAKCAFPCGEMRLNVSVGLPR